ncbi:MAG TPA: biotin--[acetyl-CoA-carboxylase] ligase [Gemmatimonadaceae bacterium]|nr:biotin--[acetyl-CoA-carboxylase] ligase [Gemmatimonadaceae bacterium]
MSADPAPGVTDRYGAARTIHLAEVTSTLDVAYELAAQGAPGGTLIVADMQTAGRGRMGRTWRSEPGAGIWLTLIERPRDASALEVLSLRIGLALAPALDGFASGPVRLKWPNDLYVGEQKLAGVLIEARWREAQPEWVAIGVGINLRPPAGDTGSVRPIGLSAGVSPDEVLLRIVRPMRAAARRVGPLGDDELAAFAARDLARGRRCVEPVDGVVQGIDASGALVVDVGLTGDNARGSDGSTITAVRAGSLVLEGTSEEVAS